MRHYCTLFDTAYAAKGLALYESLCRHSTEPFVLHILAMDNDTFWILTELKLEYMDVIPINSFESALQLKSVRESRSWQEYCWTCASSLMEYLLPQYDAITYIDADVFFYSDPKIIFDEVGEKSIGITPHRFNVREHKRLSGNGLFNVGIVVIKNTVAGLACVSRWANQCREWCFNRNEDGKFGDQAYLDSWGKDYGDEVCVIENIGVNLGPWNIGNFCIHKTQQYVTADGRVLVCYHFHEFKDALHLTGWRLRPEDVELIYKPYIRIFTEAQEQIKNIKALINSRREANAQRT